jgi:hypothetical protein
VFLRWVIDKAIANLSVVNLLCDQAKEIAGSLYEIAAAADHEIEKVTTYEMALESLAVSNDRELDTSNTG